jgi:hypothetical protein
VGGPLQTSVLNLVEISEIWRLSQAGTVRNKPIDARKAHAET